MKGYKFDACSTIYFTWKRNISIICLKKVKCMRLVDALFDITIDVLSEEEKTVIRIFLRTRP